MDNEIDGADECQPTTSNTNGLFFAPHFGIIAITCLPARSHVNSVEFFPRLFDLM